MGWWAPLRKGLFTDPKHRDKIGTAIWLYGYLHQVADWETGRLTIKVARICKETGMGTRTVKRHLQDLRKNEYIEVTRRPHDLGIQITKWRPISKSRGAKNGTSGEGEKCQLLYSEVPTFVRSAKNGTSVSTSKITPKQARGAKNGTSNESLLQNQKNNVPESKIPDASPSENFTARRTQKFTTVDLETAEFILEKIRTLKEDFKQPNLNSWADDIRLMRERDGRAHQEIRDLFTWANANLFWRSNILSPGKLRKQWDQLCIQRQAKGNGRVSQAEMNSAGRGEVVL